MTSVIIADERVAMSDGTKLATEVFRPSEGGPRPTLLVRTPYGRKSIRQGLDPIDLVRAGWVVVTQDVRARWDSEGQYEPWTYDIADGADTISWCREQPWSNGRVAMQGASYDGITAWLAAAGAPEGLTAISTVVSSPTIYDPLITRNGLFNYGFLLHWCLGHAAYGSPTTPPQVAQEAARRLGQWRSLIHEPEALQILGDLYPPAKQWLRRHRAGEHQEWLHVVERTELADKGLPVYQITGWFDCFVEGAISAHIALQGTGAPQRLVIGPWSHGKVFSSEAGDVDSGPRASGWERFPGEQLEFLTTAVEGRRPEGGVSVWVIGADRWADLDSWPPPTHPSTHVLQGHSDVRWDHDPRDPVPTRGGRTLLPDFYYPAGPCRRTDLQDRSDLVRMVTEPFSTDATVMGLPSVRGSLTTDTDRTDLFAFLGMEDDGQVIGVLEAGVPLHGTGEHEFDLPLGNIALHVRRGQRLVVDICSSNFPAHLPTPQPGSRKLGDRLELLLPLVHTPHFPDER